jgi:Heterokaryon incompatibility protein (HET)
VLQNVRQNGLIPSLNDISPSFSKQIAASTPSTQIKMRLLNARTKQFQEFFDETPPYAILSHTWGSIELTFKQMEQSGYIPSRKIDGCCEQALKDSLMYVWADTCCIDKSSSAELSEAINSMYAWYGASEICYAYLSDVPHGIEIEKEDSAFSKSRWFTRGWTLQELIAPGKVAFYDESWKLIGRKSASKEDEHFRKLLSRVTRINSQLLEGRSSLGDFSVAQRMSWAAYKTTTRAEDVAYSLLGLFGVNMPLLYGEGVRAFVRLQEEILKASDDESIFAWGFDSSPCLSPQDKSAFRYQLFASSPAEFASCMDLKPDIPAGVRPSHYTLTNKGLYIEADVWISPLDRGLVFARLNCAPHDRKGDGMSLALSLVRSKDNDMLFFRHRGATPVLVSSNLFSHTLAHIYLHRSIDRPPKVFLSGLSIESIGQDFRQPGRHKYAHKIQEFYPSTWTGIINGSYIWDPQNHSEFQHQNILFSIENDENRGSWPNYAVWLEYRYSPTQLFRQLVPKKLKCRASILQKGKSLAEAIIQNRGVIKAALDWQEALDLGVSKLSFRVDDSNTWAWALHIEIVAK